MSVVPPRFLEKLGGHKLNRKTIKSIRAQRSLHLIDIENLCGESNPTVEQVAAMKSAYEQLVKPGEHDLFLVTLSSKSNLAAAVFGWKGAQVNFKEGHDGADILIAKELMNSRTADLFGHVYVASGDGGLAPFVSKLKKTGTEVSVVSAPESLSHYMRYLGVEVRYLDRGYALAA